MASIPDLIPKTILLNILMEEPNGWKVHELLSDLEQRGYHLKDPGTGDMKIFRKNFWLLHQLHSLRRDLLHSGSGDMRITTLDIRYLAANENSEEIDAVDSPGEGPEKALPERLDPMDQYYLDASRFWETSEEEVAQLLDSFWKLLDRQEALPKILEILELGPESSQEEIRSRLRQKIKAIHPDHGGDPQEFQTLWETWKLFSGD